MKVKWSRRAVQRLAEIKDYISENNPENAKRFIRSLKESADLQLQSFPKSGRKIPELGQGEYREMIFKNYRVMYKVGKDEITILTVRNSRQLFSGKF